MDPKELEAQINDLETRIERLKALYEQYFQGIERLEPQVPRKDVDRRIMILRKEQIRSSTLRFRFQSILQRYTSYQSLWGRITRQIEEGTYRRDVMKVRQQRARKAEEQRKSRPPEWQLGVDFEDTDDFFKSLGFDDANVRGQAARASRPPPPMESAAPAPASMSFARPKDPSRPQTVPPRGGKAAPTLPSLAAPRVPDVGANRPATQPGQAAVARPPAPAPRPGTQPGQSAVARPPSPPGAAPRAPMPGASPVIARPPTVAPPPRPPTIAPPPRPATMSPPPRPPTMAPPARPAPITPAAPLAARPPMSVPKSPLPEAPKPIAPPRAPTPPKK